MYTGLEVLGIAVAALWIGGALGLITTALMVAGKTDDNAAKGN